MKVVVAKFIVHIPVFGLYDTKPLTEPYVQNDRLSNPGRITIFPVKSSVVSSVTSGKYRDIIYRY
jgi:hypothetical protein